MLDQQQQRDQSSPTPAPSTDSAAGDVWEEAGDEDVPTVVLYIIAGLLVLSFTLYLVVGGGHGHFH